MTVGGIIEAVRLCIDEQALNGSNLDYDTGASDNELMDNIIRGKIGDALRWVCLYGPADLLNGSDETEGGSLVSTGILIDVTGAPTSISGTTGGKVVMPTNFLKLARIRVNGWHRAIQIPIAEDSEEYIQLYDSNGAAATVERPQAAFINKATKEIEVWPTGTSVEYTYVANVNNTAIESDTDGTTVVALPPAVKTSFIYYLAFLLLSAYNDPRSVRMLEIAKMNLSATTA